MDNKFVNLIRDNLPATFPKDFAFVKSFFSKNIDVSLNKANRILKSPASATNLELVRISDFLKISCWELIKKYGVGKEKIEKEIQDRYKKLHEMERKNEALEKQLAAA